MKSREKLLDMYHNEEQLIGDFPTNVLDVVMMGRYGALGWIRRPKKTDRELAMNALEKVGMEKYSNRQISQLSGGQTATSLFGSCTCSRF